MILKSFNIKLLMLLFLVAMGVPFFQGNSTYQANGADGSTGIVQFGFGEYNPGDSYSFILKSLTVSADYTLDFTAGCADQYNFTTGASETSLSHRVTLNAPTSGSECIVTLEEQSTGTAVDTIRLQSTSIAVLINQSGLITLLMLIIVIVLVLAVIIGIKKNLSS